MIALRVGGKIFEIGSASFFKSFFSTVFVRLEDEDWGSKFPKLMNNLYMGRLEVHDSSSALKELQRIRYDLRAFPPNQIVWDFENRGAKPPWGDRISTAITSLANYFVTSDGKDLIDVMQDALTLAQSKGQDVLVV